MLTINQLSNKTEGLHKMGTSLGKRLHAAFGICNRD